MIRVLRVARRGAMKARIQAGDQLEALIITAPEPVRAPLRELTSKQRIRTCAALRPGRVADPASAVKTALRALARRWQALQAEIDDLDMQLTPLVTAVPGVVGPNEPAPAAPWRGSPGQQRPVAHRAGPYGLSPGDQGLRGPAHRRGQDQDRDHALPQAVHCPRGLPPPAHSSATRSLASRARGCPSDTPRWLGSGLAAQFANPFFDVVEHLNLGVSLELLTEAFVQAHLEGLQGVLPGRGVPAVTSCLNCLDKRINLPAIVAAHREFEPWHDKLPALQPSCRRQHQHRPRSPVKLILPARVDRNKSIKGIGGTSVKNQVGLDKKSDICPASKSLPVVDLSRAA
jgi:hypothetical protein